MRALGSMSAIEVHIAAADFAIPPLITSARDCLNSISAN
jgi:hypothetical protein